MTDVVNLSPGHAAEILANARNFRYAGHHAGWVIPNTDTLLADLYSSLSAGPYNAFNHASSSSLDVTIDTGEALVLSAALARDTQTTVSLSDNTTGQTVYVGWSETSQDTVIVGLSGAFTSTNPKIPIWEFDTDAGAVSASTDLRDLGERVDVENTRYETSDQSGAKVDKAVNADQLGNLNSGDFLRSDMQDAIEGVLGMYGASTSVAGSLGQSDGEYSRAPGGTSDLVYNVQGGHGRVVWAWNAYYDSANSTWRSIIANEPHAAIAFDSSDPGDGTGVGHVTLAAAPSNGSADSAITWQYATFDENGNLDLNGGELHGHVIEPRSSRPSSPSPGRIIYRTDKD